MDSHLAPHPGQNLPALGCAPDSWKFWDYVFSLTIVTILTFNIHSTDYIFIYPL